MLNVLNKLSIILLLLFVSLPVVSMQRLTPAYPVVKNETDRYIEYSQKTLSPSENYEIVCSMDKIGKYAKQIACYRVNKRGESFILDKKWFEFLRQRYERQSSKSERSEDKTEGLLDEYLDKLISGIASENKNQ